MKSPLLLGSDAPHVHPRQRKRLSRCTLDCGFKTSESPALRGFEAERCPIRGTSLYLVLKSNGLRHSKNLPEKFGFSSKSVPANIAKKLPPQRCSKLLLIAFSASLTNGPRSLSCVKAGTHSAFGEESHTAAHTAKHGCFTLAVTWRISLLSHLDKEKPEEADARPTACVRFLRRRSPAGLRCPVCNLAMPLFLLCAQGLLHARGKGKHHHSRRVSHVVETPSARLSKRLTFASMVRSGDTYPPSLKESHVMSHTLKERALLLRPQLSSDLPLDFVATAFVVWYNLI